MSTETKRRGRQPLPPPSERQRKQLERLYVNEGLTVEEIANRLGMTRGQVQGLLVRAGIPRRHRGPRPLPPPSKNERRQLEKLYLAQGMTVAEVGRKLGTTRERAEAMLVRANIPLRRYGDLQLPPAAELARVYIRETLSTRDLARMFGTHQATVWRALADAGIPRRPRGSGNKAKWPEKVSRDDVEDLYVSQRLPMPEVARRLGVGPESVSRALRAFSIPADGAGRRRRCPPRDELVDLYVHQGLSTAELAARFNVHRRTPWHWLDDNDIPRRPGQGVRKVRGGRALPVSPSRRRGGGVGVGSGPGDPALGGPGADATGDELLTPAQAADILEVDPKTVSRWAREGRIAAQQTAGGHRRFSARDVAAIARARVR